MDFILQSSGAQDSKRKKLWLRPDEAKKSVFWLDLPDQEDRVSMPGPVEGIVTRKIDEEGEDADVLDPIFAWGGLQLMSNAKAIEIYYMQPRSSNNDSPTPKETYLTTIKGIPAAGSHIPDAYKALCAVPGGPRGVVAVRLKFLSLQPKGTTTFHLMTLKWTARITTNHRGAKATTTTSQSTPLTTSIPSFAGLMSSIPKQNNSHSKELARSFGTGPAQLPSAAAAASEALTKEDVGAAMAGMTFALRSTEERITAQIQKIVTANQILQNQVQVLSQQILQQTQLIQYQTALLQRQQETLADHTKTIESLKETNESSGRGILSENVATEISPPVAGEVSSAGGKDGQQSVWLQYASMQL